MAACAFSLLLRPVGHFGRVWSDPNMALIMYTDTAELCVRLGFRYTHNTKFLIHNIEVVTK